MQEIAAAESYNDVECEELSWVALHTAMSPADSGQRLLRDLRRRLPKQISRGGWRGLRC